MKKLLNTTMLISVMALTGCGFKTVDQGNTGVKKTLGKVQDDSLPPGFYTFNPFLSSITEMNNQTQTQTDKGNTYTKDVQQADLTYVVNYNLSATASVKIYSTVGEDWDTKLLPQVISGEMKNIIGTWNASDLVANREKAADAIQKAIAEKMAPEGIQITGFQLTNIQFRKEFEDAVENKVVAIQKADEAKNQTVQVQEQANQRVIAAQADAKAMQIKSEALSKNQSLIAYEAVQKWDGTLPTMVTGAMTGLFSMADIAGKAP